MAKSSKGNGPIASEELLTLIERWERLDGEEQGIKADKKDVMNEAKSRGYDPKTMREIIKLRKLDPHERREREALLDTYKAALGMLDGTPLGHWALERLSKPAKPENEQSPEAGEEKPEEVEPEPEVDIEEARRMGKKAAESGEPVTANPFPARDVRRAAWDEAWCAALGSDGMDIPDALKPTPKPKKGGGESGEEPKGGGK